MDFPRRAFSAASRWMPVLTSRLLAGVVVAIAGLLPARADTHIFAGAAGTNSGDALVFTVASLFDTRSGYKLPMVLRTNGNNASYHRGDTLTFTALSATDLGTGQVLGRALLGSRLAVQVTDLAGPAGGAIGFWEGDGENPGNQVTFSVPVGTTGGMSSFVVSENDGTPGSDPYGHIHGREFTATTAGLYTVGFRLVDVSTNGPGGGPLHSPSSVLSMYFQAGPVIETVQSATNGMRVFFRSAPGVTNVLEASDDVAATAWRPVSGGLRGNSALQSLTDTNPAPEVRVYRLRLLNIPP
ncbi:MAG: hypothetical protein WCP53_08405 [Verrucomicrobiota bacterium]